MVLELTDDDIDDEWLFLVRRALPLRPLPVDLVPTGVDPISELSTGLLLACGVVGSAETWHCSCLFVSLYCWMILQQYTSS